MESSRDRGSKGRPASTCNGQETGASGNQPRDRPAEQKETATERAEAAWRRANEIWRTRGPVDENGKLLPPDPNDYRFDEFGRVRRDVFNGDPVNDNAVMQGLENHGIDPETGKITRYEDLRSEGYERESGSGRWSKPSRPVVPRPLPDPDQRREHVPDPTSVTIGVGKQVVDTLLGAGIRLSKRARKSIEFWADAGMTYLEIMQKLREMGETGDQDGKTGHHRPN